MNRLHQIYQYIFDCVREALDVSFQLFKIMVPLLLLTKILEELGAIEIIADALSSCMGFVGLPGEMGIVWATALVVGTYGSLMIFLTLIPTTTLTIAQTTVIMLLTLIAHSFPVEIMIARKAGMRIWFQLLLRIGSALIFGRLLNIIYLSTKWLQSPSRITMTLSSTDLSLKAWAFEQIQSLFMIFVIILALIIFMRLIDRLGITTLLIKLLNPILKWIGISDQAIPVTVVGMVLGLSYGGGLIINEANSGKIAPRDMFFALSFMCILHSVIEDTITMLFFGADISGLLFGRLIFSFAVIFILVQIVNRLSENNFEKYLFKINNRSSSIS